MVKEKRKEKWEKRNRGEERKETRDEAKRYTASSPFKDSSTVAVNRKVKKNRHFIAKLVSASRRTGHQGNCDSKFDHIPGIFHGVATVSVFLVSVLRTVDDLFLILH